MKRMYSALVSVAMLAISANVQAQEPEAPPALPAPEPAPAPAATPAPAPELTPTPSLADTGPRPRVPGNPSRFRLGGNIRAGSIADNGFDQIASRDAMPAAGLDATVVFFRMKRFSLATGLNYDFGGRQGDVRNVKTKLGLHHLLVPLEGRFGFAPWLDIRARLAPGASFVTVDFGEGDAKTTASGWTFSTEASIGTSFRLLGNREEARTFEMWGLIDGGYLLSTTQSLDATRTPPEKQLGAQASTNYGQLSPRGGFIRFGLAMAF